MENLQLVVKSVQFDNFTTDSIILGCSYLIIDKNNKKGQMVIRLLFYFNLVQPIQFNSLHSTIF